MELPFRSWSKTLRTLGLARTKKPSGKPYRSLCLEPLEVRAVLTTSVTIAADASTIGEASGSATGFTLTRDNTSGSLTIPFTVGGTATNGTDYSTLGSSVTFTSGNSTASIGLTPTDDYSVEGSETVSINLVPSLDNSYTIPPLGGFASITITDDDTTPTVSVTASGTPAEGGATGTYTVSRTGSTGGSLTVNYMMSGTATGGGMDYTGPGSSVTIASGQSSATITLTAVDDSTIEPSESAMLTLSSSMNYSLGSPSSATLNIADNDYITVAASGSPSEVGPTNGTYTITRPGSTASSLMVSYVMSGTAVNGTDYSSLLGSVTIASGSSTATVTLTPSNDSNVEGSESAILTLSTSTFYTPSPTSGAATLNIADNEYVWVTSSGTPSEQGPATGTYTIHRPGSTSGSLSISYSMSGTATGGGTDYATLSGTASIASGQSTVDVTLTPVDDALIDAGETSILTLNSGAYTPDPSSDSATLTIGDNEVWVTASGDPSEHNEHTGTFTFHRNGPTTSSLVVQYGLSGTATHGADYVELPTSSPGVYYATIPAGESSVDALLEPIDDADREGNETVIATPTAPSGCSVASSAASATLTIDDNDEWTVGIVALGDGTALESGPGPGQFLIYRTDELDLTYDLTVNLEIDEASTASSADHDFDYSTYVIPAGQASVVIDVTPVNDALPEDDELLTVNVVSSDDYAIDATDGSATLTIIDNDQWTVGITALVGDAFEANELPGSFLITRSGQTDFSFALTVNVAVDNASTASSADYDFIYESYEIPASQASVLIPIVPVDDSTPESNEDLILGVVDDAAYTVGENDSATVTIHDDIAAGWNTVTISADTDPAEEYGPVTRNFTLTRTGPTGAALPVGIFIMGTATQGVDYQNLSGTDPAVNYVTIPADQSSVTVTVVPVLDQKIEGNETVYVSLTSAGDGSVESTHYTIGTARDATITITDYTTGPFDDEYIMYKDLNDGHEYFNALTPRSVLDNDPVTGTISIIEGEGYGPFHGTVTMNSNGTFQYVADEDWPGTDSFVYAFEGQLEKTAKVTLIQGYTYRLYCDGNAADKKVKATPGILLDGGDSSTDDAHTRFMDHVNGGDVLVVMPDFDDEPLLSYLYSLGGANSIEIVDFDDDNVGAAKKAANDKDGKLVLLAKNSEGDYFSGGGQETYVKVLPDTEMLSAINTRLKANDLVIGGSSAGMAILAGYIFTAENGTVKSAKALENPMNPKMTFHKGIFDLPMYMNSVITDTHMQAGGDEDPGARDVNGRMGRSVAFLGRMWAAPGTRYVDKAICAASNATVFIERDGTGTVYGTGYVYFLRTISPAGPVIAAPLNFSTVSVVRIGAGGWFNVADWAQIPNEYVDADYYSLTAVNGVVSATSARNGIY